MTGFLAAFVVSFGLIFVAELGDKSQLMALTLATRYRTLRVMIGITIATAVVHAVSVAIGYGLGATLPTGWIALIAAIAFAGFGAWTLRGDSLNDGEQLKAEKATRSAIVAASAAFFLAELGDKTMLATITLATQHGWFGVWVGSTLGMVAADGLAIVVGRQLGRHLPKRTIAIGASALFFAFGVWLLTDAVNELTGRSAWELLGGALSYPSAGWIAFGFAVLALLFFVVTPRVQPVEGGVDGGHHARRDGATPGADDAAIAADGRYPGSQAAPEKDLVELVPHGGPAGRDLAHGLPSTSGSAVDREMPSIHWTNTRS